MNARTAVKFIPMVTVFVLTAIATTTALYLPPERKMVPLALLLDFVPLGGVVTATAFAVRRFRRVSLSRARLLVAVYGYFAGGLVGTLGVAHTVAVTMAEVGRA